MTKAYCGVLTNKGACTIHLAPAACGITNSTGCSLVASIAGGIAGGAWQRCVATSKAAMPSDGRIGRVAIADCKKVTW